MSPAAEATVTEVFRQERGRLWGFFLRGAGSPETAEDLLQELFLRLWDHRDDLGGPDAARAYAWRAARNQMIDEIRRRVRQRAAGLAEGPLPDAAGPAGDDPASRLEHRDCLRTVRETVDRLPNPRARRCLKLWLEGNDVGSIAAAMRMGAGQVRGLLQRGRNEVVLRAADRLRGGGTGGKGR